MAARERWVRAPRAASPACANGRATPVNRRFHRGTKKIHAPNKSLEVLDANIGEIKRLINNLNFSTGCFSTERRYYDVIID